LFLSENSSKDYTVKILLVVQHNHV
jgi:hypothetical protein